MVQSWCGFTDLYNIKFSQFYFIFKHFHNKMLGKRFGKNYSQNVKKRAQRP